jgi:signal transduction histidine kinase
MSTRHFAVSDLNRNSAASIDKLFVDLSYAQDLKSIGDTVGSYCSKAFCSPAGMILVQWGSGLQLVSQWPSRQTPEKLVLEEFTKNGPVARVLRTGEALFWRQERAPHSNGGRYLHRLLQRCQGRNITFLPIGGPQECPMGVLVIVLPPNNEFGSIAYDNLAQLGRVVSGCIIRARAYEEALAARAKAEDTIKSKDDFLSILSHELKNPMMPILGWAVALSSGTLSADKQNLAIEGIIRNVRTLNYLIEGLFDAMRISSGKFQLELGETRIQDVAREALAAIQHNVESKKLRISTDISEAIPAFPADSRRLLQVLMNLLNNAVKFTPGGGSIALRIHRSNHSVECIISDTGKGIERKFLPFVFDRYRQEQRSSKMHAAGLGLGLAIVREIVELHGGSIEAFSDGPDKGSTFIVRLPMRRKHKTGE